MLGHGPAASELLRLFLSDTSASAALEPARLAGKPLPFVQVQLFFLESSRALLPFAGPVRSSEPCLHCSPAPQPGEEDLGLGKEGGRALFFASQLWTGHGAGLDQP